MKKIILSLAISALPMQLMAHDVCKDGKVMIKKGSYGYINYKHFDDLNNRVGFDYNPNKQADIDKGVEEGSIYQFEQPVKACINSHAFNQRRYSVTPIKLDIGEVWVDEKSIVIYN